MNNTTTASPYTNATFTYPLDYYYAFFVNPVTVVRIYQIAYPITFLLGFIGNTASLITFSRSTLRKVSTGCLFIMLAISDTFYLLMCIFDFVEFGLKVPFYPHINYDGLCRFRSFVLYVSQVLSSWILVTISFDRWIRTRFPYKSGSLCTPKKALIMIGILLILDVGIHAQLLTSSFGMLIPGFSILACGPSLYNLSYFLFYFLTWFEIQIVIICLLPVTLMTTFLIDIIISIRVRKRAVAPTTQNVQGSNQTNYQKNLQRQMFILMTASICIFLITTLPVAIYKITSPRQSDISTAYLTIVSDWAGLLWLQSLNYAVNFYIHCLTSTLFRKEFKKQIRYLCGDRQVGVQTMDHTVTAHNTVTRQHKF